MSPFNVIKEAQESRIRHLENEIKAFEDSVDKINGKKWLKII